MVIECDYLQQSHFRLFSWCFIGICQDIFLDKHKYIHTTKKTKECILEGYFHTNNEKWIKHIYIVHANTQTSLSLKCIKNIKVKRVLTRIYILYTAAEKYEILLYSFLSLWEKIIQKVVCLRFCQWLLFDTIILIVVCCW